MLRTALPVLGPHLVQSVMLTALLALGCALAFGVALWLLLRRS